MKRSAFIRIAFLMFFAVPIILSGCGTSPPSKFYALNAVKAQDVSGQVTTAPHIVLVAVGPIQIPEYLDRPQIVTRTAQNDLTFNEFDRWGGSLRDDIERVLIEDLSGLLASNGAAVLSWQRRTTGGYRVPVEVNRFDAVPGGSVLLKATWGIASHDGTKVFLTQAFSINQALSGNDYNTVVAGMSQALGALSQEIATSVKSLIATRGVQPPTGTRVRGGGSAGFAGGGGDVSPTRKVPCGTGQKSVTIFALNRCLLLSTARRQPNLKRYRQYRHDKKKSLCTPFNLVACPVPRCTARTRGTARGASAHGREAATRGWAEDFQAGGTRRAARTHRALPR
ncbi:MAG: hypothetical protein H6Q55_4076 [Deltaproteobacteria bacterium]|nr:hypothetical protein [Deltaproteobacteria bacterium]